ncbi:TetR/AcrR family transcriptional regulator [Pseudoxanthomonas sp.]|uniref:TetR/AcrR family transcriptional regulator n=1 Tax=Pseudoxanthomonas sp. TaxID=1871049 RepID=UPI00260B59FC|nr:TetR/AcrR family transcriptional regulator [Pseudoxanthomonas sp.]WDS34925.1 MAG: TetR/AcrR family transcriptional regulator [Pseudoxanthomonas sp.]
MTSAAPAPLRRRADAAQNRAALLRAAEEVFTELGVQAPLDAVSKRAGLGRATLFRNFPDRQTLVMALLESAIEQITSESQRLLGTPDELIQLLHFILDRMVFRAPLVEYWQTSGRLQPEMQAAIASVMAIFEPVIQRAVAAGRCRADLVSRDVLPLLAMFSGSLCGCPLEQRDALAARTWVFAMDIVKPAPAQPPIKG